MTTSTPSRRPRRARLLDVLEAIGVVAAVLPTFAVLTLLLVGVLT